MNLAELEKQIHVVDNPMSGATTQEKRAANEYCNRFISENFMHWKEFFNFLCTTENESTKHWLLLALHDIVKEYWGKLEDENKESFVEYTVKLI